MNLRRIVNSFLFSNTYIIQNEKNVVIVDCGNISSVIAVLKEFGIVATCVKGLLVTHAHIDHIYGLNSFSRWMPDCKIFISEFARQGLYNPKWNLSAYYGREYIFEGNNLNVIDDSTILLKEVFPELGIQCIHTPGHDSGCMSFIIGDYIFTGDSYIPGMKTITTIRGNKLQSQQSETRIKRLIGQAGLTVCPGHGDIVPFTQNRHLIYAF